MHLDTVQQLRCLRREAGKPVTTGVSSIKCGNPIELQPENIWIDFITHRSWKKKTQHMQTCLAMKPLDKVIQRILH